MSMQRSLVIALRLLLCTTLVGLALRLLVELALAELLLAELVVVVQLGVVLLAVAVVVADVF